MALVLALFNATAFSPADVEAVGVTITYRASLADRHPTAIGWTWCGGQVCKIEVRDGLGTEGPGVLRHEVCHAVDWLSDGVADGAIAGWEPWADGTFINAEARPEWFGYWCGRQLGVAAALRGEVTW